LFIAVIARATIDHNRTVKEKSIFLKSIPTIFAKLFYNSEESL
jgi:hypothetical protein